MTEETLHHHPHRTRNIVWGMLAGVILGLLIHILPYPEFFSTYLVDAVLDTGGTIFIRLMKMMIVPIVLISLVSGVARLGDPQKLGRMGAKTLGLYLLTTAIAVALALLFSTLSHIGMNSDLSRPTAFVIKAAPSLKQTLLNMFPINPIAAMANGEMLQIIVFALLFGSAIGSVGTPGKKVAELFEHLDLIVLQLINVLMMIAPLGVFCLISSQFANAGFSLILHLIGYFMVVLGVLILHALLTNSLLLVFLARLNPLIFFKKMLPAMTFAFSTSSSSVSIPVTLTTVEDRLGVHNSVAAFVIPLGATINMDGTAIMQGVATVFIANIYHIHLGLTGFFTVIATATLASIGTAGVPSVGLITLAMVLQQVGLPTEGIALIIGVDRLLDMVRTAVNITGDATVSCIISQSEGNLDKVTYLADVE